MTHDNGDGSAPRRISAADIRAADALYEPFPSFSDWSSLQIDDEVWDAQLARLSEQRESATAEQLDETAQRLFAAFRSEMKRQTDELDKPSTTQIRFADRGIIPTTETEYRIPIDPQFGGIRLNLTNAAPAQANIHRDFEVVIAKSPTRRDTFRLVGRHGPDILDLGLEDVFPELTADASFRIATFVTAQINNALHELAQLAAQNRVARGY